MKQLKITINGEVKTFDLPENGEYKCEVMEHYVPKAGDCVMMESNLLNKPNFYWFKIKKVIDEIIDLSFMVRNDLSIQKGGFFIMNNKQTFTQITPEELKAKYAEAGYDWDYETDTIKPIKWVPKDGDKVWYLSIQLVPARFLFNEDDYFNKTLLEKGLLFQTEEECQKFADHCMEYIK